MQWYKTSRGAERLDTELKLLAHGFPRFIPKVLDDGAVVASGLIGPSDLLKNSYYVVAEFPYTYGDGNRVNVYLPDEELPSDTPHVYSDSEICIDHNDFTPETDIIDVLGWTIQWLVLYEDFLKTGRW